MRRTLVRWAPIWWAGAISLLAESFCKASEGGARPSSRGEIVRSGSCVTKPRSLVTAGARVPMGALARPLARRGGDGRAGDKPTTVVLGA